MGDIFERGRPSVVRTCPICGKTFIPTNDWAYRKGYIFYCRYNCYRQAGGDSGEISRYTRERVTNIKRKK